MARKFRNWIDGFDKHTSGLSSPDIFRKWGAIAAIAGALERKVWITTDMGTLYPNLYVIIVGGPGVGKTVITNTTRELWSELADEGHHLASDSITKASLVDELRAAERKGLTSDFKTYQFNSLKILSNELAVLVPGYDNDFMNTLTHLYDNLPYSERRRTKDLHFSLPEPQINILAATTPSYLSSVMPAGAWDQGFLSRTLIIYSGQTQLRPLFGGKVKDKDGMKPLLLDLKHIGKLYGRMTFEPDTIEGISEWHMAGGPPTPDHPRLLHYNTRRTVHLLKLCMVASVAETDDLVIKLDHFATALDWLLEAEACMPDIFKAMSAGGDSRVIEETWHFAYTIFMKEKTPVLENRLVLFIQQRTPSHNVLRILEVMEKGGLFQKQLTVAGTGYVPKKPQ